MNTKQQTVCYEQKCFCTKPRLVTTINDYEIVCSRCGVVFGYDYNSSNDENTTQHRSKSKSSNINLYLLREKGGSPKDNYHIINKKLRIYNHSDISQFSDICSKLELNQPTTAQCWRLYQKLRKSARFTRAKAACFAIYYVCKCNKIPFQEENIREIVRQTLGVKKAPKEKSVIYKVNKLFSSTDLQESNDAQTLDQKLGIRVRNVTEDKKQFYLNLHISEAQKKLGDALPINTLKRLASQNYEMIFNSTNSFNNIDPNTRAKKAVGFALQMIMCTGVAN